MVPQKINGSVGVANGKQCYNFIDDQYTVMGLLNMIPEELGGTMGPGGPIDFPPASERRASQQLVDAIYRFQRMNSSRGLFVDGHVDPGQRTLQVLNEMANMGFGPTPKPMPLELGSMQHLVVIAPTGIIMSTGPSASDLEVYAYQALSFRVSMTQVLSIEGRRGEGSESGYFQTSIPVTSSAFAGPVRLRPSSRKPSGGRYFNNGQYAEYTAELDFIFTCNLGAGRTEEITLPVPGFTEYGKLTGTATHLVPTNDLPSVQTAATRSVAAPPARNRVAAAAAPRFRF